MGPSKFLLSIIFLLLWLSSAYSHEHAGTELTFGLYANENPTFIVTKFRPILNEIEHQFNLKFHRKVSIKTDIARTYQQGVDYLVSGRFDFARFGAASYIIAKSKQANIDVLAVENKKGKNYFTGVIFVSKKSDIQNILDLKNKSFAFGGLNSTIGRYLSQQLLYENGIKAETLSHYDYLGRHDDVAMAVSTGTYDAGAVKKSTYNSFLNKGHQLQIIHEFNVPTKPWLTSAGIDQEIKQQLQEILLEYQNIESLSKLNKQGFAAPSIDIYEKIEKAINNNEMFFFHE